MGITADRVLRQLAECCRIGDQRRGPSVSESADRLDESDGQGGFGMAVEGKRVGSQSGLAVHHRRCACRAETPLSDISRLTGH